ncbi:MAG: hypothetical protein PHC59_12735 [Thomasclavelia ramosa]|nr:hypothetical protein [Thomasclavelia ramosa]
MEVKVEVGLSRGLENIMNRFISAIEGINTPHKMQGGCCDVQSDVSVAKPEGIDKVKSISDVEMAEPVEDTKDEVDQDIDYPALRKEIKKLGIKLVQAKKQSEVKTLTAKYGYTKMDELPDDKLAVYLEDLKEIQNG